MKRQNTLDLDEAEKFIQQITKKAGFEVKKLYGKIGVAYTKQNPTDVVTKADIISHALLTSAIKKKYPRHGIISEEDKDYNTDAEYVWIIDPLDGTRNYATKTPMYGVIVALAKKEEVILGAIILPEFNELYVARRGKGAFLNGKKIMCSSMKKLEYSYGTEGGNQNSKVAYIYGSLIEHSKKTSFWINTTGCGAVASMFVASGRRDWFITPTAGGVWDRAAPFIILKEAGCKVTDLKGKEWTTRTESMVAANPVLHKELLSVIKKAKRKK
jgi:myo-inositol-1(or 4)-monophosphatase